jgi:acetyltransferase-like isoleucine patch superfamily enzyme
VLIWSGCRIEALENATGPGGAPPRIVIGDGVSMQQDCHVTAGGELHIGAGTTILYGAMITDMDHRYDAVGVPVTDQPIDVRPTTIGPTCFIGSGARILPGTTLGAHCVVGANAVVRGTFAPGSVIAGIPGRVVRQFDPASGTWRKVGPEGAKPRP